MSGGTSISGSLQTQTLTKAGSPYRVVGDLTVPAGHVLTIDPGVAVVFQGHYRLSVVGRIVARGNAAQPILFTASDVVTGWNGLRLAGNTDGLSDVIDHCIFEFANKDGGIDGAGVDGPYSEVSGGAIWINARSNVTFNNNEVRFCKAPGMGGAIALISPSGPGAAVGNNVHDNQCTGPRSQFAGVAGGIYFDHIPTANAWTVRGGEFRNNSAAEAGAFYYDDASGTLDSIAMSGNTPQNWVTDDAARLTIVNTPLP
jgi:hypothetical protein